MQLCIHAKEKVKVTLKNEVPSLLTPKVHILTPKDKILPLLKTGISSMSKRSAVKW